MKMTEFYEKYWTVNGKPVPPLPQSEKLIWDTAEELGEPPYIQVWRRRKFGWEYLVNPVVQKHIDVTKQTNNV